MVLQTATGAHIAHTKDRQHMAVCEPECQPCPHAVACRTTTGYKVTFKGLDSAAICTGCLPGNINNIVITGTLDGDYIIPFNSILPASGPTPSRCLYRQLIAPGPTVTFDTYFFPGCVTFLNTLVRTLCVQITLDITTDEIWLVTFTGTGSSTDCTGIGTALNVFFYDRVSPGTPFPFNECDLVPAQTDCSTPAGTTPVIDSKANLATAQVVCVDPLNP